MADEIQTKADGAVETASKGKKKGKNKPEAVNQIKNTLESVEKALLAEQSNDGKFPAFSVGDTVRVNVKIVEGDKQRIQPYEGTVLAEKHGSNRKSFTVRRVSYGVAIERVFPFHSPYIESVELVRKGRVRRAKLYYLRGRFGRSAVITEKV